MSVKTTIEFIGLAKGKLSYESEPKARFHRKGRALLREIARLMKIPEGTYEIRSNMGGIAVSGEVILHSENIYVQLSQSFIGPDAGVMYRRCNGRKDCCGGRNHWMSWAQLLDLDATAQIIKRVADDSWENQEK
jgi:hypothetical protein